MKQSLRFFISGSDLGEGIARAETSTALQYVRSGYYDDLPIPIYRSAGDIPEIDTTPSEAICFCPSYIAMPQGIVVRVNTIQMTDGGTNYKLVLDEHPEGFLIHFGGMYKGVKLMAGSCYPYSDDDAAVDLCNKYTEQLTLGYIAVRDSHRYAWMVGPEAFELLKQGFPLQTDTTDWEIITPDAIPRQLRGK